MSEQQHVRADGTVTFLPHRLNRHPVVVRGLTADELWICCGLSGAAGLVVGAPLSWVLRTIAIAPTFVVLGVALGVVLTPQLAAAKAADDSERYSAMLDWGLRLVVLLSVPCAVGLLTFAEPLVATLFHRGALHDSDVGQIALALMGYGAGLLGLVAIKVLAPGYYASQDIRTPVKIAIVVLVITQLLNLVLVPWLKHTGLALSIGLAALVNASWLLIGLLRRGTYKPGPGWLKFTLQVIAASALLAVLLLWGSQHFDWVGLRSNGLLRAALLAAMMAGAAVLYFGALRLSGLNLRQLLRR